MRAWHGLSQLCHQTGTWPGWTTLLECSPQTGQQDTDQNPISHLLFQLARPADRSVAILVNVAHAESALQSAPNAGMTTGNPTMANCVYLTVFEIGITGTIKGNQPHWLF